MVPRGHVQTALWFTTSQSADTPQEPGHGSLHLVLMHAKYWGQSESMTHSGLHPLYAFPIYPGRQVHLLLPPTKSQTALGPQKHASD